ncbi:MAG: hypothetical protein ACK2U1_12165 [Anaerolineales bacterium]
MLNSASVWAIVSVVCIVAIYVPEAASSELLTILKPSDAAPNVTIILCVGKSSDVSADFRTIQTLTAPTALKIIPMIAKVMILTPNIF